MEPLCPTCGVSLGEIPFERCATHDAYFAEQEPLSIEEAIQVAEAEYLRESMERTGDD